ncbi:hypothetical protein QFZ63_006414 [Streptomyces sp. B3I7]|nr:hypothetical protein [Streptomyces sp. B3I7]
MARILVPACAGRAGWVPPFAGGKKQSDRATDRERGRARCKGEAEVEQALGTESWRNLSKSALRAPTPTPTLTLPSLTALTRGRQRHDDSHGAALTSPCRRGPAAGFVKLVPVYRALREVFEDSKDEPRPSFR